MPPVRQDPPGGRFAFPHRRLRRAQSATASRPRCGSSTAGVCAASDRRRSPRRRGLVGRGRSHPARRLRAQVLIDGAQAFPAIADAIGGARDYVHVTGWHLAPHFDLAPRRDAGRARRAPGRGRRARPRPGARVGRGPGAAVSSHALRGPETPSAQLTRRTRIRCEPDPREHPFHCHHEKTRRRSTASWRSSAASTSPTSPATASTAPRIPPAAGSAGTTSGLPPARSGGAAMSTITSPCAGGRSPASTLERPPEPVGGRRAPTCRWCGRSRRGCTTSYLAGDFRILESYVRALRHAGELVYLENQFLWSPEIVSVLADKLRHPPARRIPARGAAAGQGQQRQDDTQGQLAVLIAADDGARPAARGHDPLAQRRARRPALRPRQGRHRRRPLADGRLGQPQLALAVQRHRDERRHARS